MACRLYLCRALSLALLALVPTLAAAQAKRSVSLSSVKVKTPRTSKNVPLRILVTVDKDFAKTKAVKVTVPGGELIPGQLSRLGLINRVKAKSSKGLARELHVVLPKTVAGQTLEIGVRYDTKEPHFPSFAWGKSNGKYRQLSFHDRPVLRYMHEKLNEKTKEDRFRTYKVFHHLFDPSGKRLVTKGAGGLFPHHRGLFYGFNRISYGKNQNADVWHCNRGESQQHAEFLSSSAGPVMGRHCVVVNWHGRDGKPFAVEEREYTVYDVKGGQMVEFASQLRSLVGKVKLDGDPQHAGFQFRASQDVPDKTAKLTYYLRPDGKDKPGSYRNWSHRGSKKFKNLPWNAMSIVLDEKRYTACYLDHPANPKEARYSERNYGRFGSYFEYELDTKKPLTINYRLWFQKGEMTVKQVQGLSEDFVKSSSLREVAAKAGPKKLKKVQLVAGGVKELDTLLAKNRGSVVLVDFWATWCAPCVKHFPKTVALSDQLTSKGLRVISVSIDDLGSKKAALKFLKKQNATFPNLISKASGFDAFKLSGLPLYRLYDRKGILRYEFSSLKKPQFEKIKAIPQRVIQLLQERE